MGNTCHPEACSRQSVDWACYCVGDSQRCEIRTVFYLSCAFFALGLLLAASTLRAVYRARVLGFMYFIADRWLDRCVFLLQASAAAASLLWAIVCLSLSLQDAGRTEDFSNCDTPESPTTATWLGLAALSAFLFVSALGFCSRGHADAPRAARGGDSLQPAAELQHAQAETRRRGRRVRGQRRERHQSAPPHTRPREKTLARAHHSHYRAAGESVTPPPRGEPDE